MKITLAVSMVKTFETPTNDFIEHSNVTQRAHDELEANLPEGWDIGLVEVINTLKE